MIQLRDGWLEVHDKRELREETLLRYWIDNEGVLWVHSRPSAGEFRVDTFDGFGRIQMPDDFFQYDFEV